MCLRKYRTYLIVFSLMMSAGCIERQNDCSSVKRYLREVHSINVEKVDNLIVLIVNMNGCNPCLLAHAKQLRGLSINYDLLVVAVGDTQDINIRKEYRHILQKFNTAFDKKAKIYDYPTAFGKPLIFHFKKGDCILRKEIADNEIIDTYSYIKQNL